MARGAIILEIIKAITQPAMLVTVKDNAKCVHTYIRVTPGWWVWAYSGFPNYDPAFDPKLLEEAYLASLE